MGTGALRYAEDEITCVVDELVDTQRGYARGPERALLSALLFDGIQSYMSYVLTRNKPKMSRFAEAYHWVSSHSRDYVFSFECVCEALGIDAEFLRIGLANATHTQREALAKSRRHY
ncbi:MAG: hypothetical protein K1X79_01350 [Oligoflexia bacterium]|nr:hypothetical protein [Oligoflexia bacterium]